MKYTAFFILAFVSFLTGAAQDTIYKRNGEVIPSKISEISSSEVKYKRFSMPDGAMFIIPRNDVQKIRFANGVIDSFAVSAPVTTQTVITHQATFIPQKTAPALNNLIYNPRPGKYYFNQASINEKKMLFIAMDKNRVWKDKELTQAIMATRDYKNNQYISGFGGPVIMLVCFIAGSQVAQAGNSNVAPVLVLNGIGIFAASQIISPMFKRKRTKSARRAVELYNLHQQQ